MISLLLACLSLALFGNVVCGQGTTMISASDEETINALHSEAHNMKKCTYKPGDTCNDLITKIETATVLASACDAVKGLENCLNTKCQNDADPMKAVKNMNKHCDKAGGSGGGCSLARVSGLALLMSAILALL